jgi:hypothetical protein
MLLLTLLLSLPFVAAVAYQASLKSPRGLDSTFRCLALVATLVWSFCVLGGGCLAFAWLGSQIAGG